MTREKIACRRITSEGGRYEAGEHGYGDIPVIARGRVESTAWSDGLPAEPGELKIVDDWEIAEDGEEGKR